LLTKLQIIEHPVKIGTPQKEFFKKEAGLKTTLKDGFVTGKYG